MSIDVLVYSHHRYGGGTPLDSLWFSAEACAEKGVYVHFAWTGSRFLGVRALARAKRVLFDGVNAPRYYAGPAIWWIAKVLRKPRAIYWHETAWLIEQAKTSRTVCHAIRDPDVVHFHVCEAGVRQLVEKYGIPKSRTRVLNNMSAAEGWDTYSVPAPVIAGLFVTGGPLQQWKGPDLFLEVAKKMLSKRPEACFLWMGRCGGGKYSWRAWRNHAVELGVGDRVMFLGQVERPMELLSRSEAVILTSRSEGMPKLVIEALAVGKKVVAFDVGGVAEALKDLGCVVRAWDIDAFCDALSDQSDVSDVSICKRRRQRYVEHYTPAAFASRFVEAVTWWDEIVHSK